LIVDGNNPQPPASRGAHPLLADGGGRGISEHARDWDWPAKEGRHAVALRCVSTSPATSEPPAQLIVTDPLSCSTTSTITPATRAFSQRAANVQSCTRAGPNVPNVQPPYRGAAARWHANVQPTCSTFCTLGNSNSKLVPGSTSKKRTSMRRVPQRTLMQTNPHPPHVCCAVRRKKCSTFRGMLC
jgi:hypothetical protein